MSARRYLLAWVMLMCLVASCGGSAPPPPEVSSATRKAPAAALAGPSILPNQLVKVDGQVTLTRPGAAEAVSLGVGAEVEPGDLLRVEGGDAALFCGNEAEWDRGPIVLAAGKTAGVSCLAGRSPRSASDLTRLRGDNSDRPDDIPYVVSPRTGFVLSDRPTLRWHTLPNIDTYTVTLVGDDEQERAPVEAKGGELAWPDSWPALKGDGSSYRVVVKAGERSSDDETSDKAKPWGFSLLDPAKADQLKALDAKLSARPLSPEARALLLAELYLGDSYGLRSEAVALLSGAGVKDLPAAQISLGEVYVDMKLVDEAKAAFDAALASAQKAGLRDFEARAEFGLGTVACGDGEWAQAEAHWQKAQTQYKALGMAAREKETAEKLAAGQDGCAR